MSEYCVNVFLNEEEQKKIEELGLGDQIQDVGGKKGVKVGMSKKDLKKLQKGFPDLTFDADDACELPDEARGKLVDIILDLKTTDVMKFAITKLYNPLAGRAPRSKVH
jgi:hypothetical protein